ncbi:ASCH domain-containing protein [Bdellovibrio sp.]|uniref:ASCH domain-containing protein n=1 Tax=Bdellovibrio sp. TaxID=28201 RepID=UPI0039E5DC65
MDFSESVKKMWQDYHRLIGTSAPAEILADLFCNNEKEANELAILVNKGIKRATAQSLWSIQKTGGQLPSVDGIFVVTDWDRNAVCIVKTTKVSIIPFNKISEENAYREGEGDRTLQYWRRVHIKFYKEEFEKMGLIFNESMPIVFEEFEKVFP